MSGTVPASQNPCPQGAFSQLGDGDRSSANHKTRFQMLWKIMRLRTVFWGIHRHSNTPTLRGEGCRSENSNLLHGLKGKTREGRSVPGKAKHRHKGLGATIRSFWQMKCVLVLFKLCAYRSLRDLVKMQILI